MTKACDMDAVRLIQLYMK